MESPVFGKTEHPAVENEVQIKPRLQAVQEKLQEQVTGFVPRGRPPALILWSALYFFLGFLIVLIVGLWMRWHTKGFTWGDPQRPGEMFAFHPLFMTLGLLYIHGFANLSYRLFPGGSYLAVRIFHALLQATAMILAGCGIYAVYFYKEHMHARRWSFHFTSVHSWLGLITVTLAGLQLLCGFFGLLFPGLAEHWFQKYRIIHKSAGKALFFLICGTALVGLDQVALASSTVNVTGYIVILYAMIGGFLLFETKFEINAAETVNGTASERAPMLSAAM